MPRVDLKTIWTDSDGMFKVVVGATNGSTSASMEVYSYPADIDSFATSLLNFPAGAGDEAQWVSGDADPKWYGHMSLRAYLVDHAGHSAIEVLMNVRGEPPNRAMSNFFLRCNPADLNELGRRIKTWLSNPSEQLAVEWRDA